jgi:hypothetical protein
VQKTGLLNQQTKKPHSVEFCTVLYDENRAGFCRHDTPLERMADNSLEASLVNTTLNKKVWECSFLQAHYQFLIEFDCAWVRDANLNKNPSHS